MSDGERPASAAGVAAAEEELAAPSRPSITKQFKYERLELPTTEQLQMAEVQNLCIVRALISGLFGGVAGVGMGVVMGALDTSGMDHAIVGEAKKPKTTLQVLRESARATKDRSVCVLPLAWLGRRWGGCAGRRRTHVLFDPRAQVVRQGLRNHRPAVLRRGVRGGEVSR